MLSTNTAGTFKLTHGSSFNTNLEPHLDVSVHNVPFGDTMRWTDIIKYAEPFGGHTEILTKEIEVKANVDAVLSAQLVIYKTRKMGILIIKDGKETSSPQFQSFRRTIMDKCCVKKIMKIPSTAFTHTNTKTICIYFTKPLDGRKTGSIQFCQLNDSLDTIHEICQVPRDDLEARFCSWNPQDYLVDEHAETMKGKSVCEWKKLSNVVDIIPGEYITKTTSEKGEYPVYGGGDVSNYINKYNRENKLVVAKDGVSNECIRKVNGKFWLNHHGWTFNVIDARLSEAYFNHIMLQMQQSIIRLCIGGAQQGINQASFKRVEIPVPSLEIQNETVAELDELGADKDALTRYHKNLDNHMKLVVKHTIKENLDTIRWRKLGELLTLENGRYNTEDMDNNGNIPFYSCKAINPVGYHSTHSFDGSKYLLVILAGGSSKNLDGDNVGLGNVYTVSGKTACRSGVYKINLISNLVSYEYVYYYLKSKKLYINSKAQFTNGLGIINPLKFQTMEIPVPSLEVQQQMVAKSEQIEARKLLIQAEINTLDDMMKDTLELSYTSTASLPDFHPPRNSEIHEENPETIDLQEPVKPTQVAELVSSSSEDETESETDDE